MYITTNRLKEQLQFMNDSFIKEKEQNQINSEYGFINTTILKLLTQVENSEIGKGIMAPYLFIDTDDQGQKQIVMQNLTVTRVAANVWANDRVLVDFISAARLETGQEVTYDLTEYFNDRYEKFAPQKMIDPATGQETETPKPSFEQFLASLK